MSAREVVQSLLKDAVVRRKKKEEEDTPLGDAIFPKMFPWQAANVAAGLGTAGLGAGAYAAGSLLPSLPKELGKIDQKAIQADTAARTKEWFEQSVRKPADAITDRAVGKDVGNKALGAIQQKFMDALAKAQEASANSTASKAIEGVYNPIVDFYNKNMPAVQGTSPLLQAGGLGLGALGAGYGLYHGYRMLNPPKKKQQSLLELAAEDVR